MAVHFGMYAELERQLREALNAPPEEVAEVLTKTQRRKNARYERTFGFKKAAPVARPDKTTIRLNCLPFAGPAEIHEFSYYTPFREIALQQAIDELAANGKVFKFVTVIENEKHT